MTTKDTKFIRLLKKLDEAELKSFALYLQSPWCNTNKIIVRLLEKIKNYHPDFDTPKMEKEKLFKRILPNGKFSDRRMNNIFSDAYLALEKFLLFQRLQNDQSLQQNLLMEEWQSRHLEDWFFKEIQQKIAVLEAKPRKEWEDYLELFRWYRSIYHHPSQYNAISSGGEAIVKMGELLDLVFLLEKGAIINEKIERTKILKNENYEVDNELKTWRAANEQYNHPLLAFYEIRFNYSEKNQLENYFNLRDTYLKKYDELSLKGQKSHFLSLKNDTIRLIRARHFDITELLPLFKFGLNQGFLLEKGVLSYINFSTIVSASNTKRDFDFTKELIEIYSNKLAPKLRAEGKAWATAHTFYYKGELEECLEVLLINEFKNAYYVQISKLLTTQVYFDLYLNNADAYQSYLFSYFDSYEKWIQREKFNSKVLRKSYLRFVQLSRILAKSFDDVNFRVDKIEFLLQGESNIQASEWLKRKIKQVIELKEKREHDG